MAKKSFIVATQADLFPVSADDVIGLVVADLAQVRFLHRLLLQHGGQAGSLLLLSDLRVDDFFMLFFMLFGLFEYLRFLHCFRLMCADYRFVFRSRQML